MGYDVTPLAEAMKSVDEAVLAENAVRRRIEYIREKQLHVEKLPEMYQLLAEAYVNRAKAEAVLHALEVEIATAAAII